MEGTRILHRETKKLFGTLISFFRTFISVFRGEFSFAPWRFPNFSVESTISRDARVAIKWGYSTV